MDRLPASARLLGIGFYVGICIAGGTMVGQVLDNELDTGKVLTLAGLGLGLVAALWGGVRQLLDVLDAINRGRTEGKRE